MRINPVSQTIADYCRALARGEVQIDRRYQRSPQVWPLPARSYLIETILRGFPIPKLAVHQVTDRISRQTVKYVVDGQQRTAAIQDFLNGEMRLTRSLELKDAAGATYEDLPPELQEMFLSYLLQFDQFEAATDEDVREYFRRINSFTAPLNAEEKRHARFQGPMKWFVHALSQRHSSTLVDLHVLTEKSVIRMADAKLTAEVVHALTVGVRTTSAAVLDRMYRENDRGDAVAQEEDLRAAIDGAFDAVLGWPAIRDTPLMRTNVFYSLVLATISAQRDWGTLASAVDNDAPRGISDHAAENLLTLAAALEEPESEAYVDYTEFTDAAAEKTNVAAQRLTRVRWLRRALVSAAI